jgi:hypothetical protein
MVRKRRSAYELPFESIELTAEERRKALLWWQSGADYHPLLCPVCGATLAVAAETPELHCPTVWCSYASSDIPWGVYVAWRRFVTKV